MNELNQKKSVNSSDYGVVTEAGTIRFERLLPGPIERVWEYLVNSEKRRRWLAPGEMQVQAGSEFALEFNNTQLSPDAKKGEGKTVVLAGQITQCDVPHRFSFIWAPGGDNESEVTIELSQQGEQVLLVLTHRRLNHSAFMLNVSTGWHTHLQYLHDTLSGRIPGIYSTLHDQFQREYQKILASH